MCALYSCLILLFLSCCFFLLLFCRLSLYIYFFIPCLCYSVILLFCSSILLSVYPILQSLYPSILLQCLSTLSFFLICTPVFPLICFVLHYFYGDLCAFLYSGLSVLLSYLSRPSFCPSRLFLCLLTLPRCPIFLVHSFANPSIVISSYPPTWPIYMLFRDVFVYSGEAKSVSRPLLWCHLVVEVAFLFFFFFFVKSPEGSTYFCPRVFFFFSWLS